MTENCIRYLLLHNQLPQNLAVLHTKHSFGSMFPWLGIQEKRSLVVPGAGTRRRLQSFFCLHCSHLKALMGWEGPLPKSHAHVAAGGRPQVLAM